eukprot:1175515-Prorocentrum_minimum.AAC.1
MTKMRNVIFNIMKTVPSTGQCRLGAIGVPRYRFRCRNRHALLHVPFPDASSGYGSWNHLRVQMPCIATATCYEQCASMPLRLVTTMARFVSGWLACPALPRAPECVACQQHQHTQMNTHTQ